MIASEFVRAVTRQGFWYGNFCDGFRRKQIRNPCRAISQPWFSCVTDAARPSGDLARRTAHPDRLSLKLEASARTAARSDDGSSCVNATTLM